MVKLRCTEKKNKKKNGGQMAFVFDDISAVSLEDESDSLNEYLFLGLSLSYETDGTFETISILKMMRQMEIFL